MNYIGYFEKTKFNLKNVKINPQYLIYLKHAKENLFYEKSLKNFCNLKKDNIGNIELNSCPYKYCIKICSNLPIESNNIDIKLVFLNTDISPNSSTNLPLKIDHIKKTQRNELIIQFGFTINSFKFNKHEFGNIFQFCVFVKNKEIFASKGFKIYARKRKKNKKVDNIQQHHHHHYYYYYYPQKKNVK